MQGEHDIHLKLSKVTCGPGAQLSSINLSNLNVSLCMRQVQLKWYVFAKHLSMNLFLDIISLE